MTPKSATENTPDEDFKSASDLFFSKYCLPEWIPLINMYKSEYTFKAGERIFNEGDEVLGVYFIDSGKVKVVSQYDIGMERILRLGTEGKFLGHRGLSFEFYPISAIALTNTTVSFFPRGIFLKLLKANPRFGLFMLDFVSRELYETEERMKKIIHHDVKMRVADVVCTLIDAFGYDKKKKTKLSFTLSRKDIANIAGTTYETVVRILIQLQQMKLIQLEGKAIHVQQELALRTLAGRKA